MIARGRAPGAGPAAAGPLAARRRHAPAAAAAAAALSLLALAAPAASAAKTEHLTVVASGDLLIHSPIYNRALALGGGRRYEFAPMFRFVRKYVRAADLAICHVETPMSSGPPHGYPRFNTPPSLAKAIAQTGWDVCSTASNHSLDQGIAGISGTNGALRRAGVRHTGMFLTPAARNRSLIMRVKGLPIAFLSYTEHTNGLPLPHPWSVNLATAGRILADARRARAAGAQAVIVNLHWGNEYQHTPSPFQRALARRLLASPSITTVVGQHAHVVQPISSVFGRLLVWGEGNLISNQTGPSQDGMLVLLRLAWSGDRPARVESIRYVPTWVRRGDYTVLPVGDALRLGQASAATLRASYHRTVAVAGRSRRVRPVPARLPATRMRGLTPHSDASEGSDP